MKTININSIILALSCALTLMIAGCKKDNPIEDDKKNEVTGDFTLKMEHEWGNANSVDFELNKWFVHPMTKDSLKFDKLRYYVSNIQLKKTDGTWWVQTESYYLADLGIVNGNLLKVNSVPAGTYVGMKYTLGVDSVRNVNGSQTGALATINDMFWGWKSGYIMMKAEGESPQSSDKSFAFHLGGFEGANNVIMMKETNFNGATLTIAPSASPMIHISSRPSMLWHNGASVSLSNRIMMPNATAKSMADNYFGSFTFEHIHN